MAKKASAKTKNTVKDLDLSWDVAKKERLPITWHDLEGCLDAVLQSPASARHHYAMVQNVNSIKVVERDMSTTALVIYWPGANADGYVKSYDSRFLGIVKDVDPLLWEFLLDNQ